MTWGDESDAENSKFKEVVLPPGMLDQPRDEVVGVTRQAPEVNPAASAARNAATAVDPASGRETWTRKLAPHHRRVVRHYFQSNESSDQSHE